MPNQAARWEYQLNDVNSNRSGPRTALRYGEAHELVGVDGSLSGGLRPFCGFRYIHEFDPRAESSNPHKYNGQAYADLATPKWGTTTPPADYYVDEMRGVTFRIGDASYGYGFIYRVRNGMTSGDSLHIDYRINTGSTMYTRELVRSIPSTSQWDVVEYGRLLYLFIEGQSPVRFWVEDEGAGVYDEICVGGVRTTNRPGPGPAPLLTAWDQSVSPLAIGSITSIPGGVAVNSGNAQVWMTLIEPQDLEEGGLPAVSNPQTEHRLIPPGDYVVAYQLLDSNTGLVSALSPLAAVNRADFTEVVEGESVSVPKYIAVEIAYDLAKYNQAIIYRSVDGAPTILQIENIIDLATYVMLPVSSSPTTIGHSIYYMELPDIVLRSQDSYLDRLVFDETMPFGGSAAWYEGTVLVSKIEADASDSASTLALGEIKWSSLVEGHPELFSPYSRYVPKVPSDEVITFKEVSGNVIGFSKNRQYHHRKEGVFIRVQEMHTGFGIVSQRAAAVLGSLVYFGTTKGAKVTDADGQLDDVRGLNDIFVRQWATNMTKVHAAYDAVMSVLFFHNPAFNHSVLMWFNTAKVTELYDVPWSAVEEGLWTSNPDDATTPLQNRAVFLHRFGSGTTGKYRLYLADHARTRASGSPQYALMHPTGTLRQALTNISGTTLTMASSGTRWEGLKLYVLDGPAAGESMTIQSASGGSVVVDSVPAGLAIGHKVGVSPVYFKWVGCPLWMQVVGAPPFFSSFSQKIANSAAYNFTDVAGTAAGQNEAAMFATLYRANAAEPFEFRVATNNDGASVPSIKEGESNHYAAFGAAEDDGMTGSFGVQGAVLHPGVEMFCPDLDFRLLSVMVTGYIDLSSRQERAAST